MFGDIFIMKKRFNMKNPPTLMLVLQLFSKKKGLKSWNNRVHAILHVPTKNSILERSRFWTQPATETFVPTFRYLTEHFMSCFGAYFWKYAPKTILLRSPCSLQKIARGDQKRHHIKIVFLNKTNNRNLCPYLQGTLQSSFCHISVHTFGNMLRKPTR